MPGLLWSSEEKEHEWSFAKKKLTLNDKLLPNGTKLRRKDYPEELNHSFMVIDDRIIVLSGKGIHLGKGRDAHTKLAEDEASNLIALKIIVNGWFGSESQIAYDLGIAGQKTTRKSDSKEPCTKHYIAYEYLGILLLDHLYQNKSLSLDKRYELCMKTSLALHDIHTGRKAKSKKSYSHGDIHWGNLLIDDHNEIHFIDFGSAFKTNPQYEHRNDIVQMLLLFFTPEKDRNYRHENWIFDSWLAEYAYSYSRPYHSETKKYYPEKQTIHLYVNSEDKDESGAYSSIHYAVLDPIGNFQEGKVYLKDLGLDKMLLKNNRLTWYDLDKSKKVLLEKKIREISDAHGHTMYKKDRNEILFNLVKDPIAFYNTPTIPTALDIAGILTLCRLRLESQQSLLDQQSQDKQLEFIYVLNSVATQINSLYEKLDALPEKNTALNTIIKSYIISHLIFSSKDKKDGFILNEINTQLTKLHSNVACSIKQDTDKIIKNINLKREHWLKIQSSQDDAKSGLMEIKINSASEENKSGISLDITKRTSDLISCHGVLFTSKKEKIKNLLVSDDMALGTTSQKKRRSCK